MARFAPLCANATLRPISKARPITFHDFETFCSGDFLPSVATGPDDARCDKSLGGLFHVILSGRENKPWQGRWRHLTAALFQVPGTRARHLPPCHRGSVNS